MGKSLFVTLLLFLTLPLPAIGDPVSPLAKGQYIYLPMYSHISQGSMDRKRVPDKALLSALISIRNTDEEHPIRVTSARYFDTNGRLVKEFFPSPQVVPPFGTTELFIANDDASGGSGANFAIAWHAGAPVSPPIIEAVHSMTGSRPFAFITTGRTLRSFD